MADETLTIKDRVAKLENINLELHKTLGTMDKCTDEISKKTDRLTVAMFGVDVSNPGILHHVLTLMEKMDDLKKMVWAIIVIVTGIVIEGLYLAISHATSVIK